MIAMLSPGEVVMVRSCCIDSVASRVLIARSDVRCYDSFSENLMIKMKTAAKNPKPKALIMSFL